jgi:hypothetical protein
MKFRYVMKNMKKLLMAILLAGCSGAPEVTEEPVKETKVVQPLTESACMGNRVPPTNYIQETAFASLTDANPAETAKLRAMASLRDRLCQGYRCGEIESRLTLWNTEQDTERVCAMVVIDAADVDAIMAAPRATLKEDLFKSAQEIENTLKNMGKKKLAFDNVRDSGVDGGPRAEWMLNEMIAALSKTNIVMTSLPKNWNGLGVPDGVDGVLSGNITRVHGREARLEVHWRINFGESFKAASPVAFPEMIGPIIDANTVFPDLPDQNSKVALRFDSRPGGALCAGQTTNMKLAVAEPLHVRVVNLYGKDEGLVIWSSDGPVKPGKDIDLGEFMAVPGPTTAAERFLVVAAKDPKDLGELVASPVPCKIPQTYANELGQGRGIKDGAKRYTTSRSFRIMEGPECSQFQAPPAAAMEGLASCW